MRIRNHVVNLMTPIAPDGVIQRIRSPNHAQSFIRVYIALMWDGLVVLRQAPVLDLDVFPRLFGVCYVCHAVGGRDGRAGIRQQIGKIGEWDGGAVEVDRHMLFRASERNDGRRQIGVGGDEIDADACGDAGSADDEGHIDVFFVGAALAGRQSVLADVEAVVRGIEDVGVIQEVVGREESDGAVDHVVDCLQGLEAEAVVLVV